MDSTPISIEGGPNLPNIGYYSTNISTNNSNVETLNQNLQKSCLNSSTGGWTGTSGIYSGTTGYIFTNNNNDIPEVISSLDMPYYMAKAGVLTTGITGNSNIPSLNEQVSNQCGITGGVDNITNQIQYLTCQLEETRNVEYNPSIFKMTNGNLSLKEMFSKYLNLKPFLICLFIISMYLFVSGFFASLDLTSNIFDSVSSSSELNYTYWIGLLLGIIAPILILFFTYSALISKNITNLDSYDITDNAYGIKNQISSNLQKFDVMTLLLFIFLIYAFIALLFTIKKSYFSLYIYTGLISIILLVISIFLYILYEYIPFFNITNEKNMLNSGNQPYKFYIDNQKNISGIITNKSGDDNIRNSFITTFIVMIFLAVLFFLLTSSKGKSSNTFVKGFLSSSAILSVPMLWVFNFIIAISYFYVYPVFFMVIRFFRYILMTCVYLIAEKKDSFKDRMSDDLQEKLNNFKNYTPSWGLIGIDELKLIMNICGYENLFSKSIISENNNSTNLSNNKFIVSGFLQQIITNKDSNFSSIIYFIIILITSIIFSVTILYGFIKI